MTSDRDILSRRTVLGAGVVAGAGSLIAPKQAQASPSRRPIVMEFPAPFSPRDITTELQTAMTEAAANGSILQLGAGEYFCTGLTCPSNLTVQGVRGHTRLVLSGDKQLITANDADTIRLRDLTFDGAQSKFSEDAAALVQFSQCKNLEVTSCEITGSSKSGLMLEQCSGSISGNQINTISKAAILSFNATGLHIDGNNIHECGDGGILVYRWSDGHDGTIISNNRIANIAADSGGTGQNGNGINVFRAGDITISNNKISDCAFSAIRANAASNVQILGNTCLRSGEVALFVEFGFQGAIVSNNLIETAANGISITNFREGGRLAVYSNNVLRDITGTGPYATDNPTFGVAIGVEADTSVTGNVIEDARVIGIGLGWGPYMRNLIASQNTIRNAPVGIAISFASKKQSALISQNMLANCNTNIAGYAWHEQVSGDLALSADDLPETIVVSNNLVSSA